MLDIFKLIAEELSITKKQVESTVNLIDEGATVPFIARYRKEITGSLDEEQIRIINERLNYIRNLEKRKEEVISSIEEQGKLTEELKKEILEATVLQRVEDLYLPYKKKKKTKADIAKENGLEPLSFIIMEKKSTLNLVYDKAKEYINENITTVEEAIEGAKLIIAQNLSEDISIREFIREVYKKSGILFSKLMEKNKDKDQKFVYQDYYEYNEPVKLMPSHRILAVNRGENESVLSINIKLEERERENIIRYILKKFHNEQLQNIYLEIINDSLDRLICPSIEREIRNILTEKAEDEAIIIFKKNIQNLLLQPPMYNKNILGLDPGYRTGCKVVVINKDGFFVEDTVVYLIHGDNKLDLAKKTIIEYIKKYDIDIIAIGNGTGSRETEKFTAEIIKTEKFKKKPAYIIVNEAGASVYSASKIAIEEFPELDVTARGAISIARRIQDPLAELVKIDPKSIGVGMYQHDVNQKKLSESLENVVESVVNNVGVNVNTASWALLGYVSGIKKNIAKNIVDYRKENGNFKSRDEIKKVKGLGDKAYTLAAGFMVVPESKNPLDNTVVHPESYEIALEILKEAGCTIADMRDNLPEVREKIKKIDIEKFIEIKKYGKETTKDIYEALLKGRRDPRESFPQPLLKDDILEIEDLKEGMELEGTVRNVIKFGAFIDIGLHEDALLHISEFGKDKFITDPTQVMAVGDIVRVKVKSVDMKRKRVSLTMK